MGTLKETWFNLDWKLRRDLIFIEVFLFLIAVMVIPIIYLYGISHGPIWLRNASFVATEALVLCAMLSPVIFCVVAKRKKNRLIRESEDRWRKTRDLRLAMEEAYKTDCDSAEKILFDACVYVIPDDEHGNLHLPVYFWDIDDTKLIAETLLTLARCQWRRWTKIHREEYWSWYSTYERIGGILVARTRENPTQALRVAIALSVACGAKDSARFFG